MLGGLDRFEALMRESTVFRGRSDIVSSVPHGEGPGDGILTGYQDGIERDEASTRAQLITSQIDEGLSPGIIEMVENPNRDREIKSPCEWRRLRHGSNKELPLRPEPSARCFDVRFAEIKSDIILFVQQFENLSGPTSDVENLRSRLGTNVLFDKADSGLSGPDPVLQRRVNRRHRQDPANAEPSRRSSWLHRRHRPIRPRESCKGKNGGFSHPITLPNKWMVIDGTT